MNEEQNTPPVPPAQKETKKYIDSIRPIRTYHDDVAQAVEKQQESLISIKIKEQQKQSELGTSLPERKKSRTGMLFTALFLLFLGVIVIGALWWKSQPRIEPTKIIETLIITDSELSRDFGTLNKEDLFSFVSQSTLETHPEGHITHLQFTGTTDRSTSGEFFSILNTSMPSALLRTMSGDMLLGTISIQTENIPFLLIEVDSFENAFAGLLKWEPAMAEDFQGIFTDKLTSVQTDFIDKVSNNKDLRILRTTDNIDALVYTFLDTRTILITTSEKAVQKILPVFISSKQIR